MADRLHRRHAAQLFDTPLRGYSADPVQERAGAALAPRDVGTGRRRQRYGHVVVGRRAPQLLVAGVRSDKLVQLVLAERLRNAQWLKTMPF